MLAEPPSLPSALDVQSLNADMNVSRQMALSLTAPASTGLDDVLVTVRQDDKNKWDLSAFRHDLYLDGGAITLPPTYEMEGPLRLTPTSWAWSQLCQRLGIPVTYFRRCPTRLQDLQFNWWVRQERRADKEADDEEDDSEESEKDRNLPAPPHARLSEPGKPEMWLLRGKEERLRAVLSCRYAPLDNRDLLATLLPLLDKRMEVKAFSLNEESLHLRIIDPNLSREVLPDDRLFVGLHIANSEVGRRAVTVDALVFRLVCTNGLIRLVKGKSLLYRRHIGATTAGLSQSLQAAIGEAVTVGAGLLERLAWSVRTPLPEPEKTIAKLSQQWRLSDGMQKQVTDNLALSPAREQDCLYGLVNAVTLAAQSLPADDRYSLEALAATLLEDERR